MLVKDGKQADGSATNTIIKLKFHKLYVKIKLCVKTHFPTLEIATW